MHKAVSISAVQQSGSARTRAWSGSACCLLERFPLWLLTGCCGAGGPCLPVRTCWFVTASSELLGLPSPLASPLVTPSVPSASVSLSVHR